MEHTRATGTTSVTKKIRLAAAVAIPVAALIAVGVAAGPSSANAASNDRGNPPVIHPTKRAALSVNKCDGTVQKRVWNQGANGWQYAGSDSGSLVLAGSNIRIKGPARGTDVLSINLSAQSLLYPGSSGQVKVFVDGVPVKPSDPSAGTTFITNSGDYYGTFAQNYCRNIGPGFHNFQVQISDNDGGQTGNFYFGLNDAMVHVEQSE